MNTILSSRKLAVMILCGAAFLGGCNRFGGTYKADKAGDAFTINFKSSDKADITVFGATKEVSYEKDGDKITIHSPDGGKEVQVFTLASDGSLSGPSGMKLIKQ